MKIIYRYPSLTKPLPAQALRSVFYRAYLRRETASARPALKMLMGKIKAGRFKPHYNRQEIDKLFRDEILAKYANGRYLNRRQLNSLGAWNDLLNNLATITKTNRDLLRAFRNDPPEERLEATGNIQQGIIMFKIIEDYIYYHPETVRGVITD